MIGRDSGGGGGRNFWVGIVQRQRTRRPTARGGTLLFGRKGSAASPCLSLYCSSTTPSLCKRKQKTMGAAIDADSGPGRNCSPPPPPTSGEVDTI